MTKQSAGLMVYRQSNNKVEVLLVHPGGPFWAKKDEHAWSIPKGEFADGEDPLQAAKREFQEEIGQPAPAGDMRDLGNTKTSSKTIYAWAIAGDLDVRHVESNNFEMEWPPHSGQKQEFPEVDKAAWFDLSTAVTKIHKGQAQFLERLAEMTGAKLDEALPELTQAQQSLF